MEHKKERILLTALKLFAEQGFRETSTAQIARKAGVANGTLFHYFPTKDDLIDTLFLICSINVEKYYRKDLNKCKTIKEKFLQLARNWIEFALDNTDQYLFINHYMIATNPSRDEMECMFGEYIEKIIQPGGHQGIFKDSPTELILDVSIYLIHVVILHFLDNRHLASDPQYVNQILSFIWDSVKKNSATVVV